MNEGTHQIRSASGGFAVILTTHDGLRYAEYQRPGQRAFSTRPYKTETGLLKYLAKRGFVLVARQVADHA